MALFQNQTQMGPSLFSIFLVSLIWFTPYFEPTVPEYLFSSFITAEKEMAATLFIDQSSTVSSVESGEEFIYTIQYACTSITDNCEGAVITDPLPPEVEYIGLVGSVHTVSEVYSSGTHTVSFTLVDPLNAGSSGQVQVRVRFPNGVTPNNALASNTVTISATNAPSVSSTYDVTATASAKLNFDKEFVSGGAAGSYTTYQLQFCNDYYSVENGTLNLDTIVLIDTLPTGSTYVSINTGSGTTGVYDAASHSVTFTHSGIGPGECLWPKVTVIYPDPPFGVGANVENTGYFSYTPVGEPRETQPRSYNHTLTVQSTRGESYKSNAQSSLYPGNGGIYFLDANVIGTEPLDAFCVNDTVPVGLEITGFDVGGWYYGGVTGDQYIIDVYYTTNLNGPTLVTGSPFSIWDPDDYIWASDLGLTSGEYITTVNWCFGDVPAGFASYEPIELYYGVQTSATAGTVTNCAEMSTTTSGVTFTEDCADLTILPLTSSVNLNPVKSRVPSTTLDKGDIFTFQIAIRNEIGTADSIENPIAYDLLPEGVSFEPGSVSLPAWGNNLGFPLPDFTIVSDYKGTGRDFLRWEWSGATAIKIPPGERVVIAFDVEITDLALGGFPAFRNYTYIQTASAYTCMGDEENPDVYDFDEDGDTAELLCGDSRGVDVNEIVSLESEKLVKGQLDATWTKYPAIGYTVPGGVSDYQLIVRNKGNIQLDSVIVIDILPFIGDQGVIDPTARNSRWSPNLVGPVSAPAGVTVYYSTEVNPCRSSEGFVPSGPPSCTTPNWTSTPPSNITTVKSLKFDFGSVILNPLDSLVLEWPMRAPVNVLATIGVQPDTIAWNSFAYIGERVDNGDVLLPSEPLKVGVSMNNSSPGVLGDFVWIDSNSNGIQNVGETGYDGMRVELFKDDGDGIANPSIDTFINFTATADGGYYLFPSLPTDDYFVIFFLPPTYQTTLLDQGGDDDLDSDGVGTTYRGHRVAISPVSTVTNVTYNYSVDLGIELTNRASVGNYVWHDVNGDGIQNEALDEGINGVTVNLYESSNPSTPVGSVVTYDDVNGNPGYFLFVNYAANDYFLEFVMPTSTTFATLGATGTADPNDSDANTSTGQTEVFSLLNNSYDDNWDAGLILSGVEDCSNNIDDDGDGAVDCDDVIDCPCCAAQAPILTK